jgi:CDP-glucose 4,6-dehydratase
MFNNLNVLVTGHTGFKGSWLCKILNDFGANVYGYSLKPNEMSLYKLANIKNILCGETIGDILNYNRLKTCIYDKGIDVIFHLAAQPLVKESYSLSKYTFDVNTIGTTNVLESLKGYYKPCVVICITTDKVYQNNELGIPFKEDDPLGGYDPYSASKAAAEIVIDSYRKSFFNPDSYGHSHSIQLASVRAGNVIGGGDFANDRIIPDIVRSIQSNSSVDIRSPNSIRPWQHVLEPLYGYISLANKMLNNPNDTQWSSAWNFGPVEESFKSVKYIVDKTIELFGCGSWNDVSVGPHLHESKILKLDSTKAMNALDWRPKWDVDTAIAKTVEIYKAILDSTDINNIMMKQIYEYESN